LEENILAVADPNDLLTLYLTNNKFKKLLNGKVLQVLKRKYKTEGDTFTDFYKNYNINNINTSKYKTLYLYHLENTIYKPLKPKISQTARTTLLTNLYHIAKALKLNMYVYGLAVTLLDNYGTYIIDVAVVCLYIANYILNEYITASSFYTYVKQKQIDTIQTDIVTKLKGILIRPSTVFFLQPNINNTLLLNSYISLPLLLYRPSLIAETITYITIGTYKIYTLTEIAGPCKILKKLTNFKQICADENKLIKHIAFNSPTLWKIGNVEKLNVIGEGVGGEVYKVKDQNTYYALKVIKDNLEVAIAEIANIKLLTNTNIVNLRDFKILPKTVDLYLEFGKFSLTTGIANNLLHKKDLLKHLKTIAKAVNYCHYNDVIHRDLKPDNIIYNGQHLVLIDFGLSVSYSSFKTYLDPLRSATPLYRAPECFLGSTKYNYKIDYWAMGLIYYFMVTKKYLIDGNNLLLEIFKYFGTPTNKTYPGFTKLPNYKPFRKYKGKYTWLKKQLGKYYKYIIPCLSVNPVDREIKLLL
jgi:hypothetical protein